MHGEDRGDESAAPKHSEHSPEDEEKRDRGPNVQEEIDKMRAARIDAEELAIEHVRNPRERLPTGEVSVSKSPDDSSRREPAVEMRISYDVGGPIEIDELVAKRRPEDGP